MQVKNKHKYNLIHFKCKVTNIFQYSLMNLNKKTNYDFTILLTILLNGKWNEICFLMSRNTKIKINRFIKL